MINVVVTEQAKRKVLIFSGGKEITGITLKKCLHRKYLKKKKSQLREPWLAYPSNLPDKKHKATVRVFYLNKRDAHWSLAE